MLPWLPMFVWLNFLARLHFLSKLPVSQRLLRFAAFVNLDFHGYHVSLVTAYASVPDLGSPNISCFVTVQVVVVVVVVFVFGATAPIGPRPPHSRGF